MELANNLKESQISVIWQRMLRQRNEFATEDGEPVKIVYPGRLNDDKGGDFRDVVIATSGGLVKGDIEVHVKSSGWQAHRHHRDPAYNRVVLHVVGWNDAETSTQPHSGRGIPILALDKFINGSSCQQPESSASSAMPCRGIAERLPTNSIAEFLDAAGEERFLAKTTKFEAELAQTEAGQILYQGMMGALGYSKNKVPMLELARRVPLQTLEFMVKDEISDDECLARQQALLLGTAGMLPSQRTKWKQEKTPGEWTDRLERLWDSFHQTQTMSMDAWNLFKVRPNNFPVRRIAAMSYIILRYKETGMLDGIINVMKEAQVKQGYHQLEKGLVVAARGYWASHFDFGVSWIRNPTMLGRNRASDIVVNVILPFALALCRFTSQPEPGNKALALYYSYPGLAANAVELHMSHQLGLSTGLVNSARRQQGLLHIYNILCTQGRCDSCRLSQLEAGHHI